MVSFRWARTAQALWRRSLRSSAQQQRRLANGTSNALAPSISQHGSQHFVEPLWRTPSKSILPAFSRRWCTTSGQENQTTSVDPTPVSPEEVATVSFPDLKCPGCGAALQFSDPDGIGYVPENKLYAPLERSLEEEVEDVGKGKYRPTQCHRCYSLRHYNKVIGTKISEEDYKRHLSVLSTKKGLIVHVVDLIDIPGSIYGGLNAVVGTENPILLVANKMDLLESPDRVYRFRRALKIVNEEVDRLGLQNVVGITLVSAHKGYGIHNLRQAMERLREGRDVYVVGCTNVGKSSLINRLLHDFRGDNKGRKSKEAFSRDTTVSNHPGTTIGLISFPLVPPTSNEELTESLTLLRIDNEKTDSEDTKPKTHRDPGRKGGQRAYIHDTPGIFNHNQIVHFLTPEEVKIVSPTKPIVPKTFQLKPGQCLMLGGLARIDYIEGPREAFFTVFASERMRAHSTRIDKADDVYSQHVGVKTDLFPVPLGGHERVALLPPLECTEFDMVGLGKNYSACDIVFSNAGWVAVTFESDGAIAKVRGWTLGGVGLHQRPSIYPQAVMKRGKRMAASGRHQEFFGAKQTFLNNFIPPKKRKL